GYGIRDCHVTGVQTCALPILPLTSIVDAAPQVNVVNFDTAHRKGPRLPCAPSRPSGLEHIAVERRVERSATQAGTACTPAHRGGVRKCGVEGWSDNVVGTGRR